MPNELPQTQPSSSNSSTSNLSDILLQKKLVTPAQLKELELEHINSGVPFEQMIVNKGLIDQASLVVLMAESSGTPFVEVGTLDIPSYVLDLVPESLATKYQLLPFKEEGNDLHIAMRDPLDMQIISIIEKRTGRRIKSFQADPDILKVVIDQQYSKAIGAEVTEALREVTSDASSGVTNIDAMMGTTLTGKSLEDAPVARIVGQMLQYAIRAKASDIHIEPGEEKTRVRFRIDGVLAERLSLPRSVNENLVSRIKILSNLKIDEKRIPQDGRFKAQMGTTIIDLRVSTLPTVFGEKVVMRLLQGSGKVLKITELGMKGEALRRFKTNLDKTLGMILVTGPTGSGKTNTLAAAIQQVNTLKVNIITLEDPVEIRILGVNQVQINVQAGVTFASGLRAILRQDPDIVMVGEIRDFETAELAIHAALTGHLVFSTLHTNSASGALPRLYDMHVEPFLLASTVNLIIAQRLVRTLCPACKKARALLDTEVLELKNNLGLRVPANIASLQIFETVGCGECNNSGFAGRTGIFEVMQMSQNLAKAIMEHQPESAIEKVAIDEGMETMIQDGYQKVLAGETTLEEVLRVAKD